MPKAIEIYADQITEELLLDADYPGNVRMFRFGWDTPSEIWEAMNSTVPAFICGRVRLVKSDDTPIMSVEDHTDAVMAEELALFASGRPFGNGESYSLGSGWKG